MEHPILEGVTVKVEPAIQEWDGDGLSYGEIDIELTDVKKECLEHSERIPQPADLIPSSGQAVQDEAKPRCLRSADLIKYSEEIYKLRMETAREQLKSAREQVTSACLQRTLLNLQKEKARVELQAVKRK